MLKGKCFFPLLTLINKINFKEDLKELITDVKGMTDIQKENIVMDKGLDLTFIVASKIGAAEKETWDFMTLYLEKPIEEVKEMDILEIAESFVELIKDPKIQKLFQKAIS